MEKIVLANGNVLCPIDTKESPKRGQRARIHPLDDECDFIFRPQFLGELVPQIDCNNCRWLDLTEEEQQELETKKTVYIVILSILLVISIIILVVTVKRAKEDKLLPSEEKEIGNRN